MNIRQSLPDPNTGVVKSAVYKHCAGAISELLFNEAFLYNSVIQIHYMVITAVAQQDTPLNLQQEGQKKRGQWLGYRTCFGCWVLCVCTLCRWESALNMDMFSVFVNVFFFVCVCEGWVTGRTERESAEESLTAVLLLLYSHHSSCPLMNEAMSCGSLTCCINSGCELLLRNHCHHTG